MSLLRHSARYHPAMEYRKNDIANSTDSQICGISNGMQFWRENSRANLEEKANRIKVSKCGNSLFRQVNSLFRRHKFAVPCRIGNRPQRPGIAAQMDARTQPKAPKRPEIPKIPCYFPCSEGIRGVLALPPDASRRLLPPFWQNEIPLFSQAKSRPSRGVSPLPLVGRGRGWGSCNGARVRHDLPTPHPDPPPAETAYTRVSATQKSDRNRLQPISIGGREQQRAGPPLTAVRPPAPWRTPCRQTRPCPA
jgi:hypothetical protein